MSELVGGSSSIGNVETLPLARVSPSLREQQRTRTRSAVAIKRECSAPSNASSAAAVPFEATTSQLQQMSIIGGILLPLNAASKPRSQSATFRPKITSRAPDPPPTRSHQPAARSALPNLHRGVYSLARAGPSIISAWEASNLCAFVSVVCVTHDVAELCRRRKQSCCSLARRT